MRLRIEAIRALRLNYTRRGVYLWLKCPTCQSGLKGWQRVWSEPETVRNEQQAIADGVFL